MGIWIVFIRGINVGGKNTIKMEELRATITELASFQRVQSYIQSGNIVVQTRLRSARKISDEIEQILRDRFSIQTSAHAISDKHFRQIVDACPAFGIAEKWIHLFFFANSPTHIDNAKLDRLKSASEEIEIHETVAYLKAPDGVGRSKLVSAMESILGVQTTARNLKTVSKMLTMIDDFS